jgi:hypothetical protein
MAAARVLILSAAIGEGHDLPARFLAAGLEAAGARAEVADGLHAMGPFLERLALSGSPFHSRWGGYVFDVEYALLARAAPVRRLAGHLMRRIGGGGLLGLIAARRPDIVVSTYPGRRSCSGGCGPRARSRSRSCRRSPTSPRCGGGRIRRSTCIS